jgi:hypothetical protein
MILSKASAQSMQAAAPENWSRTYDHPRGTGKDAMATAENTAYVLQKET